MYGIDKHANGKILLDQYFNGVWVLSSKSRYSFPEGKCNNTYECIPSTNKKHDPHNKYLAFVDS